jgi:haloalkane dehalogenase
MLGMSAQDLLSVPPRHLDVPGGPLAVRSIGRGPALVLLHGWPFHGLIFRGLVERLAGRFTCHVVDMPGCGLSEWSESTDFTSTGVAATVRAGIDALSLDAYGLVAFDLGATIARLVAADDKRVFGVVLSNTEIPGHRPPWIPLYVSLGAVPGSGWLFRRLLGSRAFRRTGAGYAGCFADEARLSGEFDRLFVEPLLRSKRALEGQRGYLRAFDWRIVDSLDEVHARIAAPVKLVWGEDDPTFPLPIARGARWSFPRYAGMATVPNARLLVHEERPDAFAAEAAPFLEACAA